MISFYHDRFARDGTPIITDSGIEGYAEALVKDFDSTYLQEPWKNDPLRFLEGYLNARVDFVDIYCDKDEQIAGVSVLRKGGVRLFDRDLMKTKVQIYEAKTVLIDNSIVGEGKENFERFTEFHEAGHIYLHQSVRSSRYYRTMDPNMVGAMMLCRQSDIARVDPKPCSQEDFREHQANVFAASIMMPRKVFSEVAIDAIRYMGCKEDFYLMPTVRSSDFDVSANTLAEYMGRYFKVSKTAALVQLRRYGLIRTSVEELQRKREIKFFCN